MKRLFFILAGVALAVSAIVWLCQQRTATGAAAAPAGGAAFSGRHQTPPSKGRARPPQGRGTGIGGARMPSAEFAGAGGREELPPLRERFLALSGPRDGTPANPQLVTALNPKAYFHERMAAIRQLSERLSHAEIAGIGLFLLAPAAADDPTQVDLPLNAIRNDLLEVLVRQQPAPPAELGELLAAIFHDRRHDVGWRDYAVQYFGHYLQAVAQFAPERRAGAAAALRAAYAEAIAETDGSLAGSALIGVEELSRSMPEFDRGWVAETALSVAADGGAGAAARTTAFQICALAGERRAVEPASLAAADSGMPASLRASAIAALGQLAERTPEIERFLTTLAKAPLTDDTDPRPTLAAQAALARLRARCRP